MEDLNLPYVIPSVSVGIKAKPHFATLDCHVATSLFLAMTNGKLTSNFSTCAHSALHQADNLAKLRRDVLSVFELIAQILCAVSKAINRARFLAIRIYAIAITSATIFALGPPIIVNY